MYSGVPKNPHLNCGFSVVSYHPHTQEEQTFHLLECQSINKSTTRVSTRVSTRGHEILGSWTEVCEYSVGWVGVHGLWCVDVGAGAQL